jgi:hypothetical protein
VLKLKIHAGPHTVASSRASCEEANTKVKSWSLRLIKKYGLSLSSISFPFQSAQKERVILTVGGGILDYSGEVATSTTDITTFKTLISSTLSTKDAEMMMMDMHNFYLGKPLPRYEYMRMLLSRFTKEIINKYNLRGMAVDGWVYIKIRKVIYGLKQAGLLANQLLQKNLHLLDNIQIVILLDFGCTKQDQ